MTTVSIKGLGMTTHMSFIGFATAITAPPQAVVALADVNLSLL